jgi:carbamoyl-phosphate synthase large subunit
MIAAGKTLKDLNFTEEPRVDGFFVKEAVLPFQKFPGVDARLGPEMRSTGEVMGHASNFGHAFVKAQMATSVPLPTSGRVFISVNDYDKGAAVKIARDLHLLGFTLIATDGTSAFLKMIGIPSERINKVSQGSPHVVDALRAGEIELVINTPRGEEAHQDGAILRAAAVAAGIPIITTLSAAMASVQGMKALKDKPLRIRSLQSHHDHSGHGG